MLLAVQSKAYIRMVLMAVYAWMRNCFLNVMLSFVHRAQSLWFTVLALERRRVFRSECSGSHLDRWEQTNMFIGKAGYFLCILHSRIGAASDITKYNSKFDGDLHRLAGTTKD
jgi:hypothetical protein